MARDPMAWVKANKGAAAIGGGALLGLLVLGRRMRGSAGQGAKPQGEGTPSSPYAPGPLVEPATRDSIAADVFGSIQPQMLALYQELAALENAGGVGGALNPANPSPAVPTIPQGHPASTAPAIPTTYPLAAAFMPLWRQFQAGLITAQRPAAN